MLVQGKKDQSGNKVENGEKRHKTLELLLRTQSNKALTKHIKE